MLRRLTLVPALALAALVALAIPAGAHVDLDPGEAVAGSTATLTFSFHHGKDGTATTGLVVQLPEGSTLVEVPDVAGFVSTVDEEERTVTWSGGSVPDGTDGEFPIVIELPATPGVVLFPTIQQTEAGDLTWISEEEGEGEGATPAPRLTLTADPNATTTTSEATTTTEATTSTTDSDLPGTTLEAEQRDDGGTSAAPWIIGSGIAALAAIVVGGTILKRRAG
jgi:uncharacterized protein YcnI